MNRVMRTAWRTGTAVSVWLYRRSDGRMAGHAKGGIPTVLLTVPGRKTGRAHTVPVAYFQHEGGYVVVGSAGGTPTDPQWFRNLRSAGHAHVRKGAEEFEASARVLEGEEREAVWRQVILPRGPYFAGYETKSGRRMPLARLDPEGRGPA